MSAPSTNNRAIKKKRQSGEDQDAEHSELLLSPDRSQPNHSNENK